MFQRNIKMNKDDYPKLVKETGWHKFSTDVTTVASVHGIENVLNPTYAPVPTDPVLRCEWCPRPFAKSRKGITIAQESRKESKESN